MQHDGAAPGRPVMGSGGAVDDLPAPRRRRVPSAPVRRRHAVVHDRNPKQNRRNELRRHHHRRPVVRGRDTPASTVVGVVLPVVPPRYAERHCQVSSGTRLALIALGENPMCLRARLTDDEWSICCVCHRPVRANEGGMRMRGNVSPVHFDCVNAGPGPGVGERPGTNDRVASAPGGSGQGGRIE